MEKTPQISALEERIGHEFSDFSLLERALTHSSLSGKGNIVRDLERLEFLGDRVLGLLVAEELWRRFPSMEEGELAPRLNAMVRKETCAKGAIALGLDQLVRMSAFEEEAGGRTKKAILGDVCEAFLGALFVDGGLEAAKRAFVLFWIPNFDKLARAHRDPKTVLQEWSQDKKLGVPAYKELARTGPAHKPEFEIQVTISTYQPIAAKGSSKRDAQTQAARLFLIRENLWNDNDSE